MNDNSNAVEKWESLLWWSAIFLTAFGLLAAMFIGQ